MRKALLFVSLFALLLASAVLLAETKPKLAVMEIDSDCAKLSKSDVKKATRYLRTSIEVAGKYIVIDKGRQDKALTKQMQQESYGACVDESCQIELGRSLAADTILRSKITEFAGECTLTATLVNLEQQAAVGGAKANFVCSVKGLRVAIDSVIAQLTGKAPAPAPSPTPTPQPDGDSDGLSYEQLMQRAEKLKAEQAAIEAARQKRLKKLEADWKKVQDVARTDLPKKERIAFVKQFLVRYPSDNPHQADAEKLMGDIEKGWVVAANAGVWRDPQSGLMWQAMSASNSMNWNDAQAYCSSLSLGGYSDWRLPSILELRSLIRGCSATEKGGSCNIGSGCNKSSCRSKSCDGCSDKSGPGASGHYWPKALPDVDNWWFWSSSPVEDGDGRAWFVGFGYGPVVYGYVGYNRYVRCVR